MTWQTFGVYIILLLGNWYNKKKNEKLDKKDFFRRLIQEVLDKKQKNGCDILDIWSQTLWTWREYGTIRKKMQKSQIL